MKLFEDTVVILTIRLSQIKSDLPKYRLALSTEETKRAKSFVSKRDRESFVLSRGALRSVLSRYLSIPANDIELSYNRHGKPQVSDGTSPIVEFNLSHSGDYALCALTKRTPIGIDIERVRSRNPEHYIRLAHRFFSKSETDAIKNCPHNEIVPLFFWFWTRKEAYVKQHGHGLALPLNNFTVDIDRQNRARLVNTPWCPSDIDSTRIYDLKVANGYCAAYSVGSPSAMAIQQYTEGRLLAT